MVMNKALAATAVLCLVITATAVTYLAVQRREPVAVAPVQESKEQLALKEAWKVKQYFWQPSAWPTTEAEAARQADAVLQKVLSVVEEFGVSPDVLQPVVDWNVVRVEAWQNRKIVMP